MSRHPEKYPRTWHLACSPGKHRDDRQHDDDSHLVGVEVVITEKLDGSGVSLHADGVFARSKVGPPNHPSFDALKALHAQLSWKIDGHLGVFGEWCHAVHAITYPKLPPDSELYVFGVRDERTQEWWSFDDVTEYANMLGLPTAPVLWRGTFDTVRELTDTVLRFSQEPSEFGPDREGVVVRTTAGFHTDEFTNHVAKWVRPNHVAGEHWTRFGVRRHQD